MENNNDSYQTMYLQALPQEKKTYSTKNTSLDISNIEGARPRFIERPRPQREVFYNRNDDIDKSHSRVIIPRQVNKPDRQLHVDDIAGTRTKVNKFTTTRKTDPLNPQYQLPNVVIMPPPEPKFIRDNMQIDDIEGTRVKQTYVLRMQRSGKYPYKQPILENKAQIKPRTNNFMLDVTDINNKQNKIKGERCTNPLNPVYTVPSTDEPGPGWTRSYGTIEGSHPHNPKQNIKCPDFSLMTSDIPGAVSRIVRAVESSKKEAVPGSQTNSMKRGLSSKRTTNPLAPKYAYPGHSQAPKSQYTRPKTAVQRFDQFIS